jgi:hypothetical protein
MKGLYCLLGRGVVAAAVVLALSASQSRAITVDGTLDAGYGSALAVNINPTGFGDSSYTAGPNTPDANGSELDAGYGVISGGNLYLFLSGNFENNGNKVDVFIADGRAGQSTLNAQTTASLGQNMNGSKFSPGFLATYAITIGDFQGTAYVEEYDLIANTGGFVGSFSLGPNGGIGNGNPGGGSVITYGINNSNVGGVTGSSGATNTSLAVQTGLELAIPLSLLGNPTGSIKVLGDINGSNNDFLSNQFLPGLPSGTGNLGNGGKFDFSGTSGEFFTVVPEPSSISLVVVGLLGAVSMIRRRRV